MRKNKKIRFLGKYQKGGKDYYLFGNGMTQRQLERWLRWIDFVNFWRKLLHLRPKSIFEDEPNNKSKNKK